MSDTEDADSEDTPAIDMKLVEIEMVPKTLPPVKAHAERTQEPQEWQTLMQASLSGSA